MANPHDFDPAASGWLVRAYYTPVSDALRGHLSGRLDVRHEIAAAGLPAPVGGLVFTVCRRTRLWRSEKLDVARELIAHFADGLAAGRSADELTKDFGPPDQAARLIRRAKLRNRPLWWQTCRIVWRTMLAAVAITVVLYSVLAARFYLGRPNVAHNYWHDINAARAAPDADRAWLLYREAAFKLGKDGVDPQWLDDGPTGKHWAEVIAWLDRHRESLELARAGSQRPRMGYLLADPRDQEAARGAKADWMVTHQSPDDNEQLIAALLPGIDQLRRLARLLAADARRAVIAGDGATALADVTALVGMSEQLLGTAGTLVEQLVGMAFFRMATDTTGQILVETPAVWSDDQLRDLAHRVAVFRGGGGSIDFTLERMLFDDLLQRAYTDNGRGDGRITPEGLRMLAEYNTRFALLEPLSPRRALKDGSAALARLIGPGVAAWIGSREENRSMYHSMLDALIAAHQGPAWEWNWQELDDRYSSELRSRNNLRYWLVGVILPAVNAAFSAVERCTQLQAAAETAIALELWRRRHGQWPERLDQLVPSLLPEVPIDRTDGQPLRYVVLDGRPVLYSIGDDRDDDGGRPSKSPDAAITNGFGIPKPRPAGSVPDEDSGGDWILWPPIKAARAEEAADEQAPVQAAE